MIKKKTPTVKKETDLEKKIEAKPKAKKKAAAGAETPKPKKAPGTTTRKKKTVLAESSVTPVSEPTLIPAPKGPEVKKAPVIEPPAPKKVTPPPAPVKTTPIVAPPPPAKSREPIEPPVSKPVSTPKEPVKTIQAPILNNKEGGAAAGTVQTQTLERKKVQFNEMMTVKDLANSMGVKITDFIKKLLVLGTPASINQRISPETATLVADSFGFVLEVKSIFSDEPVAEVEEDPTKLKSRPPVVTVMGHVDHGKTSLLDAIRSTSVAEKEAGGITQHIGAYQVKTGRGTITFLDTPGHEAFTAMRARGAMVTDIVILVVAADDSVMPQTVEAIDHAKAAGVPIVVAINKVDLPQANVNRVKQELAKHELVAEDWGGKTIMVEVSAKTKLNIDKLLEMVSLEAEILDLKANPDKPAKGIVLEAKLDPKRGVTATGLVQVGTLRIGDVVVCGLGYGRIRALSDEFRNLVKEAFPARPVEILGLSKMPQAGDQFWVVNIDREAREIAEKRQLHFKESALAAKNRLSLETVHNAIEEGKIKELPIILKADVQGSLQAIQDSLGKLAGANVNLKFVHMGVGNINESDVLLAEASNAIVFGFNVKVEVSAETEAKRAEVDLRVYKIIYEMLADIRAAMEGLLKPEEREVVKGKAEVRQVFAASKIGQAAGCFIADGKVLRGQKARVLRKQQEIFRGSISTLRRFKEDVKEVDKGYECGLSIDGFKGFQVGDIVEVFVIEKHSRRLDV